MLALQKVTKTYKQSKKILNDVHLELQRGEFLYVVGGTGAGKTTLLKLLATEESPSQGFVSLFGYTLEQVSPRLLRSIRQMIGYVPQDVRLIPDQTVFDNVAYSFLTARAQVRSQNLKQKVKEVLLQVGLKDKMFEKCKELSGGEAQRVAVARALVRDPELIVADEPTGAQDRDNTWHLLNLFSQANRRGVTIIIATHDQEMVRRVRHRCVSLNAGHVRFEEGPWSF